MAEKYLHAAHGIEIVAFVSSVGKESLFRSSSDDLVSERNPDLEKLLSTITRERVDSCAPSRCPHAESAERMASLITKHRDQEDSIGGGVMCVIRNAPVGLGEPTFHKLEALLSFAMMSIPAAKGFEIGSGFDGCEIPGSKHNDAFIAAPPDPSKLAEHKKSLFPHPKLTTKTNNSGGVQGGISNGAPIYFRVGFKPPATIGKAQATATFDLEPGMLEAKGRYDPCIVPRAVPIVEAMAAIVLMDSILAQQARLAAMSLLPPLDHNHEYFDRHDEMSINEKCEKRLLSVKWRSEKTKKVNSSCDDRVEDGERIRGKS